MIRFSTLDVEMPPIEPQHVKAWIEEVAHRYGKTIGELYYYFCSDEKLLEINRERLGHDFYMRASCIASSSTACCISSASTTIPKKTKKKCVIKKKKLCYYIRL